MIYKRFAANLRAQNWFAIAIELLIVIVGVFVGTLVANWNEDRLERAETVRMLEELQPQLLSLNETLSALDSFYGSTRKFATTAFAGWRGDPRVSDREFVIAAYQASRVSFTGINNDSWSQIFGSDRLLELKDKQLKADLASLMTQDYASMEREMFTPYRTSVRKIIPEDIQDAILRHCAGWAPNATGIVVLAKNCAIDFPDARFASAARDLRAHPELVGELRWHVAAASAYVLNFSGVRDTVTKVLDRIDRG
jgi:hypothetical protein